LNRAVKLTASAMVAVVGALCAFDWDKAAPPPADPTPTAAAVRPAGQRQVTPAETVAASWYGALGPLTKH
jgi:hypothetical protein